MNLMDVLDKKETLRQSANFSEVPAGFIQMLAMGMQSGQAQPLPEIRPQEIKLPAMNMQAPQIDMPDLAGMQNANTQAERSRFEQDKYNQGQNDLADSGKILSSQIGEQLKGIEPNNPIGQYLASIQGMVGSNNPALVKSGIESYQNLITKQGDNTAAGPKNHLQVINDEKGNSYYVDTATGGDATPIQFQGQQVRSPQYYPPALSAQVTARQGPEIVQYTDPQGRTGYAPKSVLSGQQGQPQQPQGQPQQPSNNPGNLRPVGETSGFQQYATPEAGVQAIDKQLNIYGQQHGVDTLSGVISRWAPANENNTASLIINASKMLGIGPNDKIDLSNPATRAMVTAAIIKQEGAGWKQPPQGPVMGQSPAEKEASLLPVKQQEQVNNAQIDVQKENAKNINKIQTDLTKTSAEQQAATVSPDKIKGRDSVSMLLDNLSSYYDELDKLGGVPNTEKGATSNMATAFNTSDMGQMLGRATGSKDQALRDKIAAAKSTLMPAVQKATGMVSGQLNSEVELMNFLKTLTDPKVDVSVAKNQLKTLEKLYGKSSVGGVTESSGNKEPPHPGYTGYEQIVGGVKYKLRKDDKWDKVK
jgi:hypothetical protein